MRARARAGAEAGAGSAALGIAPPGLPLNPAKGTSVPVLPVQQLSPASSSPPFSGGPRVHDRYSISCLLALKMVFLKTWVPGVHPDSDFSLANIPFGIVATSNDDAPHAATAIGSHILDLKVLSQEPAFNTIFPSLESHSHVLSHPSLNAFAALGRPVYSRVRTTIQDLLCEDTAHPAFLKDNAQLREKALIPLTRVRLHLPMVIGDYTDFYAGYHHAFGVGAMWRGPDAALQPNYLHLPVGYHGRASSIVVSGTPIVRPTGQIRPDPEQPPMVAPCRRLDIELELGCFVARGNAMGTGIAVDRAEVDHVFGYVLVNDWSARDIQNWEYVPLGPFNGKNFATTISPWVVTPDALEAFRAKGIEVEGRPQVQDYLKEAKEDSVFDISCQVDLTSKCHVLCEVASSADGCLQHLRATHPPSLECPPRTSSGHSHRCSPTTHLAAAPCAQATCSRLAPSAARRRPSMAVCWR